MIARRQYHTGMRARPIRRSGNKNLPAEYGWILAGGRDRVHALDGVSPCTIGQGIRALARQTIWSEFAKAIIPVGGVVAFIWVMNSAQGVPIPVLILLAVALFGAFLTNSTVFGRYLYAIGGNAEAARLSGINNKRNVLKVFGLLGP